MRISLLGTSHCSERSPLDYSRDPGPEIGMSAFETDTALAAPQGGGTKSTIFSLYMRQRRGAIGAASTVWHVGGCMLKPAPSGTLVSIPGRSSRPLRHWYDIACMYIENTRMYWRMDVTLRRWETTVPRLPGWARGALVRGGGRGTRAGEGPDVSTSRLASSNLGRLVIIDRCPRLV